MADTFETKLGTTRAGARTRIWLEGSRPKAARFTVGRKFSKAWAEGKLTLRLIPAREFDTLSRESRGTVSGKETKPIIDITGAAVAETFGAAETVSVAYADGVITIRRN